MSSCVKCGNLNKPGAKFCKFCGENIASALDHGPACQTCAAPLPPAAKFCKQCGSANPSTAVPAAAIAAESTSDALAAVTERPRDAVPVGSAEQIAAPLSGAAEPQQTAGTIVPDSISAIDDVGAHAKNRTPLPALKIAAALCGLAVIAGGGFYAYKRGPAPTSVAETPSPEVAPAVSMVPAPIPEPDQTAVVAPRADKPVAAELPAMEPKVEEKQASPVRVPEPSRTVASKTSTPVPVRSAVPASVQPASDSNELMARKISSLLYKANGYLENKQYDKAIATAENVLEFDPRSSAAQAMISKAKAKQLEALRSGSTLE